MRFEYFFSPGCRRWNGDRRSRCRRRFSASLRVALAQVLAVQHDTLAVVGQHDDRVVGNRLARGRPDAPGRRRRSPPPPEPPTAPPGAWAPCAALLRDNSESASSNERDAAAIATRRRTSSEYRSAGRFSAASSGCRLSTPRAPRVAGARATRTVPNVVSMRRSCTPAARCARHRRPPATGPAASPRLRWSRCPCRSWRINSDPNSDPAAPAPVRGRSRSSATLHANWRRSGSGRRPHRPPHTTPARGRQQGRWAASIAQRARNRCCASRTRG